VRTRYRTQNARSRGAIPVILAARNAFGVPSTKKRKPQLRGYVSEPKRRADGSGKPLECSSCQRSTAVAFAENPKRNVAKGAMVRQTTSLNATECFPSGTAGMCHAEAWETNLYRLGVPEKTIQVILRHANVSTTNTHYIKSAADDTRVRWQSWKSRDWKCRSHKFAKWQRTGNTRGRGPNCLNPVNARLLSFESVAAVGLELRPTDYETVALTT